MTNDEDLASSFFRMFWEWRLTNAPEYATSVGIHKYDDRLDEMSLNSYLRRTEEAKILLKEVKEFYNGSKGLPADVALNLKLVISDLDQYLNGMQFKPYMRPLNMLQGPQLDFPRLVTLMKKESNNDVNMIIGRMRLFSPQIEETIKLLKEGIRLGLVMHEVSIKTLPNVLKEIAEVPSQESSTFKPFIEKPAGLMEDEWNDLANEAKKVIEDHIKPSYIKLSNFIRDEYLSHTRPSVGVSSLPNGELYYAACLKFHTTTNLTPKEVHDIGIKEVERITQRMISVKEKVNYEGSLKDFRTYLSSDEKFNFKDSTEIVNRYKNVAKQIEEKLPDYFQVLPKAPYEVIPVPPELAPAYTVANYVAPPDDWSRPGSFYINTYKPETRKRYDVISLCLHEAIPGHHLQICLTMELGSCPDFRRYTGIKKYHEVPAYCAMNTAYLEGWGLYSEYLGEEMGLYTDPFDMFGRLSAEMLRACRLVVDTGIHAFGWSREQAIQYMGEHTASDIQIIASEVDRYVTAPGQACGYKIGELKIKELRKKAEEKLGNKFNLRMFHHTVASMGAVPLDVLENEIDSFIKEELMTN